MKHCSFLLVAAGLLLVPQALCCAEARPPDVSIPAAAVAQSAIRETLDVILPYGDDASSPGFSAPGEEREALGPNAIEVLEDGTVLLSDPVRRSILALRFDAAGRPSLAVAGPLPPRPAAHSGGVPTATRVVKTSAEDGEVVFAGGGERRVGIPAAGPLASLSLVGVDRRGRAFVVVERFRELGRTAVDRELLVVDDGGMLVARHELPEPPLVRPLVELFLTPEGVLWRLAAGADGVRVQRLEVRP